MIELNIVKEQYARMTDRELQLFAVNEADKLTLQSFHLLKAEFEKRNLDLSVIESAEIDKSLANLDRQTVFEKKATLEFTNSIWTFALDQKEAGKTNFEIYHLLLNKGVDQQYAFMLTQSLDTKSKELKENYTNEMIAGWIILCVGLLAVYLAFNGTLSGMFGLYGFLITAGGGFKIYKSALKKEKYQKITQNIEAENNTYAENQN